MAKYSRRIISRAIAEKLLAEPARRVHWMRVLAAYLVDQNLTADADLLLNDIARELYVHDGHLLTMVTSARKLSDALRTDLTKALRDATGAKHVELDERLDPSLIGGLQARTPDSALDISIRTRLRQLAAI